MLTVDDSLLIAMAEAISSVYGLVVLALIMVVVNSIVQIVTSLLRLLRPSPASAADVAKEILNAPLPPIKTGQVSVEEDIYKQYMGNTTEIEKTIPTIEENRI